MQEITNYLLQAEQDLIKLCVDNYVLIIFICFISLVLGLIIKSILRYRG